MTRSNRTALVLLLASLFALLAFLVWWLRRGVEEEILLTTEKGTISRFHIGGRSQSAPSAPGASPTPTHITSPSADDLRRILGIGPKTDAALKMASLPSPNWRTPALIVWRKSWEKLAFVSRIPRPGPIRPVWLPPVSGTHWLVIKMRLGVTAAAPTLRPVHSRTPSPVE
jgi:hypothetical protein